MKKFISVMFILIVLCSINIVRSKVVGENSYNLCLDECCRECLNRQHDNWKTREDVTFRDYFTKLACQKSRMCSECLDVCREELEKNSPNVAKKLDDIEIVENTPTNCFIETIGQRKSLNSIGINMETNFTEEIKCNHCGNINSSLKLKEDTPVLSKV